MSVSRSGSASCFPPLALLLTGIWWIIAAIVSLALLWVLAVGGLIALGFLLKFFESFWGLA